MLQAAEELDFETAASIRDQIRELESANGLASSFARSAPGKAPAAPRGTTHRARRSRSKA
jgi:hypothetical protein